MGRREEHGDGGDHGEESEDEEAEPIHHHGGELPVVGYLLGLVRLAQLVCDVVQLLEDEGELAVRAEAARARRRGRGVVEQRAASRQARAVIRMPQVCGAWDARRLQGHEDSG